MMGTSMLLLIVVAIVVLKSFVNRAVMLPKIMSAFTTDGATRKVANSLVYHLKEDSKVKAECPKTLI
jgi:hypothetical protein